MGYHLQIKEDAESRKLSDSHNQYSSNILAIYSFARGIRSVANFPCNIVIISHTSSWSGNKYIILLGLLLLYYCKMSRLLGRLYGITVQ